MYKKTIPTNLSDSWIGLIIAILLCQAAGIVGLLLSGSTGQSSWYRSLRKPGFTPPPKVFGPTWGILYSLMGIALHSLWRKRSNPGAASALRLFGGQLLLNASWTPVFFGLKSISGGLIIILSLWATLTAATAQAFRVSTSAGILLVPYWLWVGFATVLNGAIWKMSNAEVRMSK